MGSRPRSACDLALYAAPQDAWLLGRISPPIENQQSAFAEPLREMSVHPPKPAGDSSHDDQYCLHALLRPFRSGSILAIYSRANASL
jgi:hypothetical protein